MVLPEALAIGAAALWMGGGTEYALALLKGQQEPAHRVWGKKRTFFAAAGWEALLFAVWGFSLGDMEYVRFTALILSYVLLAFVDGKQRLVPDPVLGAMLGGQLLMGAVAQSPQELLGVLVSGLVFLVVMLLMALISRGNLGMGDAKLLGVTAVTAGWQFSLLIFGGALVLSSFYALWLILVKRKGVKTEIPFVPFIALAACMYGAVVYI